MLRGCSPWPCEREGRTQDEKVGPGLIGKDPECQAVHGDWFLADKEGGTQECPAEQ